MNPKQVELSPKQTSAIQALTLSDMREEMGCNVLKVPAQRRASLSEAQALQGKEALLADTIKEEMAHQTQVSVLSYLHLWLAKEIKV